MSARTVAVKTPSASYDVLIGRGLLAGIGTLVRDVAGGAAACVISDSHVAPLYADTVAGSLKDAGYACSVITFPAGEEHKRLSTLEPVIERVAEAGLTRDDVVVAVGGGVTGDLAGLVAALYLRGIKVVQVPTSLLAMVDSSVGGKTAVDLEHGKNLCGAFWQPSLVVADIDCLSTLSHELLTDSCGEAIKHGVIADEGLFDELAAHPINAEGYDPDDLVRIVARNVEIKRDVVDADERESGLRQILNFGHTIGHAVEAASDFSLGHGSCVAIGMCAITRASAALGWCDASVADRVVAAVDAYGLPTDTDIDHDVLLGFAAHDKKRHDKASINIVVPRAIGTVEVRKVSLDELKRIIDLGCAVG